MAKLIWITGLSGSGKTTIGKKVYDKIKSNHLNTVFMDGDSFRKILGDDLGHDPDGRIKNARRISAMCKFLVDQDINVICATMSLYKEIHVFNRNNIEDYIEIFIECAIEELVKRDQKNLYSRALKGEVNNVVGVDLPYDKPENADLVLNNNMFEDIDRNTEIILKMFRRD